MKKNSQPNLILHEFKIFLILSFCGYLFSIFAGFADGIIASNTLTAAAYKATQIGGPIKTLSGFLSSICVAGVGVIYFSYLGKGEKTKAYRLLGTALVVNVGLGILNGVVLFLIKEPLLSFYNLGEEVNTCFNQYFIWLIVVSALEPPLALLTSFIKLDFDGSLSTIAEVGKCVVKILLSAIIVRQLGIAGLGIATLCSILFSFLVLSIHFFKKKNSIHFSFKLSFKDIPSSIEVSFGTSSHLIRSVMGILINYLIINFIGADYLIIYTLFNFVLALGSVVKRIPSTISPFFCSSIGAKNKSDFDECTRISKKANLYCSIFMTILVVALSPALPFIYHISPSSNIYLIAIVAVIVGSLTFYLIGSMRCVATYYTNLKKIALNIVQQISELALRVALGFLFGVYLGIYGFIASQFLAFLLTYVISQLCAYYLNKKHPIYENFASNEIQVSFDSYLTDQGIKETIDKISEFSIVKDAKKSSAKLFLGSIEEMLLTVKKLNSNKTVINRITLCFSPKTIRIINKNNGRFISKEEKKNIVNNISSFKNLNAIFNAGECDCSNISSLNVFYLNFPIKVFN